MGVQVGVAGLGLYLPEGRMTAAEISAATRGRWTEDAVIQKLGIRRKVIPSDRPTDGTQEMGALAALDCLRNAGVPPEAVDVILCVGEEWKEYPLTTSACYIQHRIGAVNAWAVDLQSRCCSTLPAMKMAKDMLTADEGCSTVLICGGYRNCDALDYTDSDTSFLFNLGAGGGAILLRKNYPGNLLLGSHIISDGSIARTAGCPVGGTVNPVTAENFAQYNVLRLMDAAGMKELLNRCSMQNWYRCIDAALEKSGLARTDIDYLAALHIKPSWHRAMLDELGLTPAQTIYLEEYGHIGQVDQILSLHLALESGQVRPGSVVCMIAAGIGYTWAASILRWGEAEEDTGA